MTEWVAPEATWSGGPRREWIRSRRAAIREAIRAEVPELGQEDSGQALSPLDAAATLAVAHWAWESGWGIAEWRYNAAGIHCGNAPMCQRFNSGSGDSELRAYESLEASARDYVSVVHSSRYSLAWQRLKDGDLRWLRALVVAGYTEPGPGRDEMVREHPTVVETVLSELGETDRRWFGDAEVRAARATGRRRSSGGLWFLAAAAAAALIWSNRRG